MWGDDPQQAAMFRDMSPEERVPLDHPWRAIRALVDVVLKELSPPLAPLYSHPGRPSIAPEQWRRALLLPGLYPGRSERLLREQLNSNLLFRWLVGVNLDDPLWEASTVSKKRARLLAGDLAHAFCDQVLAQARERHLLADAPCTVDGTLIEAWAGQKSCQRIDAAPPAAPPDAPGHPSIDCRGERRPNATHASTTDPAARLSNKATGQEAKLASLGPVLMEHRHGLGGASGVTQAPGTAEREAALAMAEALPGPHRVTWGADTHEDTHDFVREVREWQVTPHVAPHTSGRSSAIDRRPTRHPGYAVSQRKRQGVEESCGWRKTVGLLRKVHQRGLARVGGIFTCAAAVDHLVRLRTLAAVA